MRVLIIGSNGFIGKNLQQHLSERSDIVVHSFTRDNSWMDLPKLLKNVDFIFHLAGVNRSHIPSDYMLGNDVLTQRLCNAVSEISLSTGKKIPIIFSSSTQVELDNVYGLSKKKAELHLLTLQKNYNIPIYIFRLPNVFGKWGKPNYNSVVATFCNNITRDLPIEIKDPNTPINLVYIDDVINCFVQLMDKLDSNSDAVCYKTVTPQYATTIGKLASLLNKFREGRNTLISECVGSGLYRALYSTYMSYVPVESFDYAVPQYSDPRGVFVEMLKTNDCGQFSYFTSHPGVTRGGHYHHSKIEKFLMIKGRALFRFKHVITGQTYQLESNGGFGHIVETVPGWTHDITNIGNEELICAIWANEVFDRSKPDTFSCPI